MREIQVTTLPAFVAGKVIETSDSMSWSDIPIDIAIGDAIQNMSDIAINVATNSTSGFISLSPGAAYLINSVSPSNISGNTYASGVAIPNVRYILWPGALVYTVGANSLELIEQRAPASMQYPQVKKDLVFDDTRVLVQP